MSRRRSDDDRCVIWIGTSGWSYRHWKNRFYPDAVAQRQWLHYYAGRLRTVEINSTFYRLQRPETFAKWAAAVPEDFLFAFKASRYLTHVQRLEEAAGLGRLLATTEPLGAKRGPMLLQLPPSFPANPGRLDAFLAGCPEELRVAVEFRDPSWFDPEVDEVLRRRQAALVWSDYPEAESPTWDTTAFLYVRRHGATGRFVGRYGRQALALLAETLIASGKDAYCYFNNDASAAAPLDALELAALVG